MKITKGKMMALLILIMFAITLNLVKENQSYKRFISEDMKQSTEKFNKHFYSIRDMINSILTNDVKAQVGYDEVNNLMIIHKTISRELFNSYKKYCKLGGKYDKSFQELYDDFQEKRYIVAEYYENLNKRLDKKLDKSTYIILGDDDISKLRSILIFYNDTKREFEKLMK
ncbi:hypothetical protein [Wukongibacter sp. M2B1]|uniref:hypothetical protein n=1 Tax=Wukongibacter sp. M2B1 TaxID=3088895 RepID=UPI003D79EBA9